MWLGEAVWTAAGAVSALRLSPNLASWIVLEKSRFWVAVLYGLLVSPVSADPTPISHLNCNTPDSASAIDSNEAIIVGDIGPTKQIGFVSGDEMETTTYSSVVNTKKIVRSSGLEVPSSFDLQQKWTIWLPTHDFLSELPIKNGTAVMIITKSPENGGYTLLEYAECERAR